MTNEVFRFITLFLPCFLFGQSSKESKLPMRKYHQWTAETIAAFEDQFGDFLKADRGYPSMHNLLLI